MQLVFTSITSTVIGSLRPVRQTRSGLAISVPGLLAVTLLLQGVAVGQGQKVTVTVSPAAVSLTNSQTQKFAAVVSGNAASSGLTWSVSPAVGTISGTGLYTAPATISGAQTVTVKATTVGSPSKSGTAIVSLAPLVSVSPTTASLSASQSQQFTAAVIGTNTGVTWSVSSAVGTLSGTGLYTAPATVSSSQTVTVTATSVANPAASASASVTITPPVAVSVTPSTTSLSVSQTSQFAATVSGSSNTGVTWSVSPSVGTLSNIGLYTAPPSISSAQTVSIKATSAADPTKSASASVALTPPVIISLTPLTASLMASQTLQFTATVSGSSNGGVTWSVNPVVGTVSNTGLYAAPASISSAQTVTVTATSAADSTKSASTSIVLTPPVTVSLTPLTASLTASQTTQFTATVSGSSNSGVTWSVNPAVGTISTSGLYAAPNSVTALQSVTVNATSATDTTKSASASITLVPPVSVSVTPTSATLSAGQTQPFAASITGTTNTAVNWTINPATGTISNGLYTAPTSITSQQTVTVTATSVADTTKSATATITLSGTSLTITTGSLPGGTTGTAYSTTLTATGGTPPYTWSILSGQLPPGIGLTTTSGVISGTPTTAGTYNMSVQITDSAGKLAATALSIVISLCNGCSGPLTITTTSLPSGTVGLAYSATLTATLGTPPYIWSIASGTLPTGLSLSSSGVISGTPSAAGSYAFAIQVVDAAAGLAALPYSVTIGSAPATDQYGGLITLTSPGGSTGKWSVEKYTISGAQRWLITTPAGHGFWCGAQYAVVPPKNLNVNDKYGSLLGWNNAVIARYNSWGFNCMAEYSDSSLENAMTAGSGAKVPYFAATHIAGYAMGNNNYGMGQVLPTDAVKDINHLMAVSIPYSSHVPDGFDPNLSAYINGYLDMALSYNSITYGDGWAKSLTSPYMIGLWLDDNDYLFGFGPGPDDCTSSDSVYHPHISWMVMVAPTQAYIQWQDTGNPYAANNWFFTDKNVYAKQNLISYLKTKYSNNIAALNTAWGSTYTAFDSAAARYTNETVATTDGTTVTYTHTLAHTNGITPGTLLIKVNGTPMGGDLARNAGNLLSKWPNGTTILHRTLNYSTGVISIGSTTTGVLTQVGPNTTSWGNFNLGATNIVPGTVVMRREPPDCRMNTTDVNSDAFNCLSNGGPYTITGSLNYSTGVITGLTISPAIPSTMSVQFSWQQAIPLSNACGTGGTSPCTITVDYDVNGWGVGTTLADENGKYPSHTWFGRDWYLAKPGNAAGISPTASLGTWTDLDAWLYNYTDALMTNADDVVAASFVRNGYPKPLMTQGIGGHYGCARTPMVRAIAAHGVLTGIQPTQPQLDLLASTGLSDIPVIDSWEGIGAQADSAGQAYGWNNLTVNNYPTQNARGTAMGNLINAVIGRRGAGNPIYQITGIKFWAYSDTDDGPGASDVNYGLVTFNDNANDGHENATGFRGACSSPISAYSCGGETYTWATGSNGDAITPIKAALTSLWNTIAGAK